MLIRRKTLLMLAALAVALAGVSLSGGGQVAVGQGADGRLNCDEAAPVVLYCGETGIDIYGVGPGGAELVLTVPYENLEISRPQTYTQVGGTEDGRIGVYILRTWQIQVNVINGNELWVARWWDCPLDSAEVEVYSLATGERLSGEKNTCGVPAPESQEPMCEYTSPTGETGVAYCDLLCEWEGGLWWCDDFCDGVPCGLLD